MILIPAIDLMNGQVVRLQQGEFDQRKRYSMDPVSLAISYKNAGFTHLHVVDLDAAKAGNPVNSEVILNIVRESSLCVDIGGGLKREEDVAFYLERGVSAVNIGSLAVKDPEKTARLIQIFGENKIYISLDLLGDEVRIHGWQKTAPVIWHEVMSWLIQQGAKTFVVTDISRDGMLSGISEEFYKKIYKRFPSIRLIASGGVADVSDIHKLERLGVWGVIIGKALLEGNLNLNDLEEWLC